MKKILLSLLPLLAFVALFWLLYQGIGKDPKIVPSPLIGKPAPDFSLPTLSGDRTLSKADLLGQAYLLNVWGSWCPNCRVEHPHIQSIVDAGLIDVYGFNYMDDHANAEAWLQRFGNPYTAVLVDDGKTSIDFGVYGAPETFFIDAQGVVRHKVVGEVNPRVIEEELMPFIRQYGVQK